MPRPKSQLPPPLRVRENQRRSRARRAELIIDLQNQLRDRQQQELESTRLIQVAARRVAWENERLRELLTLRGVEKEEVDTFLGGCSTQSRDIVAQACGDASMVGGEVVKSRNEPLGFHDAEETIRPNEGVEKVITNASCQPSENNSTFLEMSCETAASIIAGMRGNGTDDQDQARSELGCKKGQDCKVKNLKVLQVLDIG